MSAGQSTAPLAWRPVRAVPAVPLLVAAGVLPLIAVVAGQISIAAFAVIGAAAIVALTVATLRWPQPMLVVVALSPIIDRFLLAPLVPANLSLVTRFSSEGLLGLVSLALLVVSIRRGTFIAAIRHPSTVALVAFVALSLISVLVNRVPVTVAAAGLLFTLDAAVLLYLPRMVGFSHRQVIIAVSVLVAALGVAALLAIGQALLAPTILGMQGVVGRSGESVRIGSVMRDPNVLGTLLAMLLPFALFALGRRPPRRVLLILGVSALVLMSALLLTYSRGSWLGFLAGFVLLALVIDRRALVAAIVIGVVALAVVTWMPRNLLVSRSAGPTQQVQAFDLMTTTENRIRAVNQGKDLRSMFVANAIPILRDHPLVGVGPGRYGGAVAWDLGTPIYAQYGTNKIFPTWYDQRTVDNFWLHLLIEAGVLGVLAFMAVIGLVLLQLFAALRAATGSRYVVLAGLISAVLVLCVSTGTTMMLEGNTVAFVFWLLLGMASLYGRWAPAWTDALGNPEPVRTAARRVSATPS
ncbi:MAG: hypothetical protein DLM71_09780 [Chloroflexi bacterium]|nr:MAG: hypothetical protein DLM71_09780 [Chloroflexota bacterium]